MNNFLTEASIYAPKKLRDIEETIVLLKKSTRDKNIRIKFIHQLKDFTKISEIILFFTDEYNAGVITVYNKSSFKNIITSIIHRYNAGKSVIQPNKLKDLENVLEPSKMIDKIYIFIGKPILQNFTSGEIVAILLHEFGHVYQVTSAVPDNIMALLVPILRLSFIVKTILQITGVIDLISRVSMLYSLITFGLNHGLTFTQRLNESLADNYALRYGYGDELVFALMKFKGHTQKKRGLTDWIQDIFLKLKKVILFYIFPPSHPTYDTRIKSLENQIFNKYRQVYPEYKEIITMVQADYNKQEV